MEANEVKFVEYCWFNSGTSFWGSRIPYKAASAEVASLRSLIKNAKVDSSEAEYRVLQVIETTVL